MPTWPTSVVPFDPVVGTYSEQNADATIRTGVSGGPDLVRRRFTATPVNIAFTLIPMTRAQYASFVAWFKNDLKHGALAFDADHPISGEAGRFRFTSPYRMSLLDTEISVQVSLELLP